VYDIITFMPWKPILTNIITKDELDVRLESYSEKFEEFETIIAELSARLEVLEG
jgi:hypothetical protein